MNLEVQLRSALEETASAVPVSPAAWTENRERVKRDRRRRAGPLVTASLVFAASLGAVVHGLGANRPERLDVRPGTTPNQAALYTLAHPTAYADVYGPVRLGTVNAEGKSYDVVVFLGRPMSRLHGPLELMACVAVADERGVVGDLWADPCKGPAHVQADKDFVGELPPLLQTGLAALPCSYGPMGNFDVVMASTRTTSVTATSSAGSREPLTPVAGTADWPVRLFAGSPASGVFTRYQLRDAQGTVVADVPLGTPASGCVAPAPGG